MTRPGDPDLYPVTITLARYGGVYEPGEWLAFHLPSHALPDGWDADDATCAKFWGARHDIGGGGTPDEAYADLLRRSRGQEEPGAAGGGRRSRTSWWRGLRGRHDS